MKIIDFERKGNVVRFYLGDDSLKNWWGDDWNDAPYEHNAGTVYDEFIAGHLDVTFPFDWYVIEPAQCWYYEGNSPFCKEDFLNREVPCLVAVPDAERNGDYDSYEENDYMKWAASDKALKIYYGDDEAKFRDWKYYGELTLTWTI